MILLGGDAVRGAELRIGEVHAQCGSLARVPFRVTAQGPVANVRFDLAVGGAELVEVHQSSATPKWLVNRIDRDGRISISMRGGPVEAGGALGQLLLRVAPDAAAPITVRFSAIRAFGDGFGEIVPDASGEIGVDCASAPLVFRHLAGWDGGRGLRDGPAGRARMGEPNGLAAGGAGNIFVADSGNHAIRRVDAFGAVTTLAGRSGVPGAADGRGAEALFQRPRGIALAPDGSLVVADTGSHTIRRVSPAGVVTTIAGRPGEPGITDEKRDEARFCFPAAVATARDGSIIVADTGYLHEPIYGAELCGQTIRRIDAEGQVSTISGMPGSVGIEDGSPGVARFSYPSGVAVADDGSIWVADAGFAHGRSYTGRTIRRVAPDGSVTTIAGRPDAPYSGGTIDGTGREAQFGYPTQLALEPSGTLLVSDAAAVRRVTAGGVVTTVGSVQGALRGVAIGDDGSIYTADINGAIWQVGESPEARIVAGAAPARGSYDPARPASSLYLPSAVAVETSGDVVVADHDRIVRVTPDGRGSVVAAFNVASSYGQKLGGIATGPDGTIWVTDIEKSCVWRVAADGTKLQIGGANGWFGWADGGPAEAMFFWPRAIAVAADGSAWVADTNNHVLRRVTADGMVTTVAGEHGVNETRDGPPGEARFNHPVGIAFGGDGEVWVTESYGATVRLLTPDGQLTTVAGAPSVEGDADGNGGEARFHELRQIAVDARGRAWVAEGNGMLRVVERDGTVTTGAGGPGLTGHFDATPYFGVELGTGGTTRFESPSGIAFAPDGSLFVTDTGSRSLKAGVPCFEGTRCGKPRERPVRP